MQQMINTLESSRLKTQINLSNSNITKTNLNNNNFNNNKNNQPSINQPLQNNHHSQNKAKQLQCKSKPFQNKRPYTSHAINNKNNNNNTQNNLKYSRTNTNANINTTQNNLKNKNHYFKFPSYNQIFKSILLHSQTNSQDKIKQLKHKIKLINSHINLEQEHSHIKNTLLNFNLHNIRKIQNVSQTIHANQPLSLQHQAIPVANINNKVQLLEKDQQLFWDQEDFQTKVLNQLKANQLSASSSLSQQQKTKINSGVYTTALMLKNCLRKQKIQYQKESLNCFIEDDTQQENHYQSYLKFRKKVLQRQLQSDLINKIQKNKDKKRSSNKMAPMDKTSDDKILTEQDQNKNCQNNDRPFTAGVRSLKKRHTSNFSTINHKFNHQHTKFFNSVNKVYQIDQVLDSIQKQYKGKQKQDTQKLFKNLYYQNQIQNCKKGKSNNLSNTQILSNHDTTKKTMKVSTKRMINAKSDKNLNNKEQYQRNKGILLGNFGKYLKDLSTTNMVKWRIFGNSDNIINELNFKQKRNKSIIIR